jgi:hypothetical protein
VWQGILNQGFHGGSGDIAISNLESLSRRFESVSSLKRLQKHAANNNVMPCNVYKCTEQKKIDFCCDCSDFPCDHLHPFADKANEVPHNTKVFNLCLIKKMGLEAWAKDKAKSVKKTYFKGKWKI